MNELADVFIGFPYELQIDKQKEARERLTNILKDLMLDECVSIKHVIKIIAPNHVFNIIPSDKYFVCRVGFEFQESCKVDGCAGKLEERLVRVGFVLLGTR